MPADLTKVQRRLASDLLAAAPVEDFDRRLRRELGPFALPPERIQQIVACYRPGELPWMVEPSPSQAGHFEVRRGPGGSTPAVADRVSGRMARYLAAALNALEAIAIQQQRQG
jgi:hypothetical protein